MSNTEYIVLIEGLRALFMLVVPVLVAVSLVSIIIGAFQAATSIHDMTISYAARALAVGVTLYLFYPAYGRSLVALTTLAFK